MFLPSADFVKDSSASGSRLHASASPSLAHLVRQTALDIPHPTKPGKTLWDATEDEGPFRGKSIIDEEAVAVHKMHSSNADSLGISPLGSGSGTSGFELR